MLREVGKLHEAATVLSGVPELSSATLGATDMTTLVIRAKRARLEYALQQQEENAAGRDTATATPSSTNPQGQLKTIVKAMAVALGRQHPQTRK